MKQSLIYTVVCLSLSLIQLSAGQKCGVRKTSRIVGGTHTDVNEYPMMAGLTRKLGEKTKFPEVFCGATILSHYYCVTSAHCLTDRKPSSLSVLVGDWNYKTGSDTKHARVYSVSRFIRNSGYNPDNNPAVNDIAIIEMAVSIDFNEAVGPVCLPSTNNLFTNLDVEGFGWGSTSFGGPVSTTLKKVQLKVISNKKCNSKYGNIQTSHLCTYAQNKDTCQKDSGGPIYAMINGRVNLIGIISYGQGCATTYPSVNTRVTSFITWIRQNTNEAVYFG